ncbi:MAG: LptF/LptG family permease [Elusimicrobiota bacterium]
MVNISELRPLKIQILFIKYFLRYFTLSLFIFTAIFFIFSFLKIINESEITRGISFSYLSKTLLFLLPSIIATSFPFSLIFSIFFSVGDLSSRGEIIAMRVGGYSYADITKLFWVFVLLLSVIFYIIINKISPQFSLKSREYARTMINRITNITIKSNSFDNISSFTIHALKISDNTMNNITLYRNINNKYNSDFFIRINALSGYYDIVKEKGIKVILKDGSILSIDKKNYNIYNTGNFEEYSVFIPFEIIEKKYDNPPKYYSTTELKKRLKSITDRNEIFKIKKEIISRFLSSLSILAFSLVACVLAFYYEKDSKYFSFLSSIGIILFYYLSGIFINVIIRKKENLFPFINTLPILIMFLFSAYIYFLKLRRR